MKVQFHEERPSTRCKLSERPNVWSHPEYVKPSWPKEDSVNTLCFTSSAFKRAFSNCYLDLACSRKVMTSLKLLGFRKSVCIISAILLIYGIGTLGLALSLLSASRLSILGNEIWNLTCHPTKVLNSSILEYLHTKHNIAQPALPWVLRRLKTISRKKKEYNMSGT